MCSKIANIDVNMITDQTTLSFALLSDHIPIYWIERRILITGKAEYRSILTLVEMIFISLEEGFISDQMSLLCRERAISLICMTKILSLSIQTLSSSSICLLRRINEISIWKSTCSDSSNEQSRCLNED